jgi:hypothetical protein
MRKIAVSSILTSTRFVFFHRWHFPSSSNRFVFAGDLFGSARIRKVYAVRGQTATRTPDHVALSEVVHVV